MTKLTVNLPNTTVTNNMHGFMTKMAEPKISYQSINAVLTTIYNTTRLVTDHYVN